MQAKGNNEQLSRNKRWGYSARRVSKMQPKQVGVLARKVEFRLSYINGQLSNSYRKSTTTKFTLKLDIKVANKMRWSSAHRATEMFKLSCMNCSSHVVFYIKEVSTYTNISKPFARNSSKCTKLSLLFCQHTYLQNKRTHMKPVGYVNTLDSKLFSSILSLLKSAYVKNVFTFTGLLT